MDIKSVGIKRDSKGRFVKGSACANGGAGQFKEGHKGYLKKANKTSFKKGQFAWNKHPFFVDGKWAYRNKVLSERDAICEECGSTDNIHIHHIDEDRSNNEDSNLMVVCAKCHCKFHPRKFHGNQYV